MLPAAKNENALRGRGDLCVDLALAATAQLAENSRLGFTTLETASHPAFNVCNSTIALGMRATLALERIGEYESARYYDPTIGRFLSEDPLGFDGDGTNFYIYVDNNPVAFIDPSGLVHCVAGADCNFTPPMRDAMACFDKCTGRDSAVTSGRRPPSPTHPHSSHSRGEACDLGRRANPGLSPADAGKCFQQCFPQGYGQEENNAGGGTHYHFQLNTVPGGKPGFSPGIHPYNP